MKNVILSNLLLATVLLAGCDLLGGGEVGPDDTPCNITGATVPDLIEDSSGGQREYGYTRLGVKQEGYDAFVVTTSSRSPYYPNFESTTTRYELGDDPNGYIHYVDGYWLIDANFEATNASITYSVYLECDQADREDKVVSQTAEYTIYSPDLCELLAMEEFSIWEDLYQGIPASQSEVTVRLAINGDTGTNPLNKFISEDGVILKTTTQFGGVIDTPKQFNFPDIVNISQSELALDLFELTGYDKTTWPESHNANGETVSIKLEIMVCGTWHPLGNIIWQSLG